MNGILLFSNFSRALINEELSVAEHWQKLRFVSNKLCKQIPFIRYSDLLSLFSADHVNKILLYFVFASVIQLLQNNIIYISLFFKLFAASNDKKQIVLIIQDSAERKRRWKIAKISINE